jgi:hypothetical protein
VKRRWWQLLCPTFPTGPALALRGVPTDSLQLQFQYAQEKARILREHAEGLVERGKEVVTQKKEQIVAAVDAGREAYQREKSKAKGA